MKEKTKDRNFRDKDGNLYVVYCPECKRENWGPAVASGECAWCGWSDEKTNIPD